MHKSGGKACADFSEEGKFVVFFMFFFQLLVLQVHTKYEEQLTMSIDQSDWCSTSSHTGGKQSSKD